MQYASMVAMLLILWKYFITHPQSLKLAEHIEAEEKWAPFRRRYF